MDIELQQRPSHAIAVVTLAPGEALQAESGAMIAMSTNVTIETSAGGAKKALKRLFGGESFFRNTFRVQSEPGQVIVAPPLCGDMMTFELSAGRELFLQSGAYVASELGVVVDTKVGGFRGFFSGAGVFVLKASGEGRLLVGAFGAIEAIAVDGTHVVDTGHLVAWEASLDYSIRKAGSGWISSWLSGEGLIAEMKGQGTVWIQSRNPVEYGRAVGGMMSPA